MNVAKWLLGAILLLPFAELAAFAAVAAALGFAWALVLLLATSLAGALLLRHAGGAHIARVRAALGQGSITALSADGSGALVLLAGILLLIPGFITDLAGVVVLLRALGMAFQPSRGGRNRAADGLLDLEPEQWRHVPDPALNDKRNGEPPR